MKRNTKLKKMTLITQEVSHRTINSAQRNLWPQVVTEKDVESVPFIMEDIVFLARLIELNVCDDDVKELVEGHNEELTTKELPEQDGHQTRTDALSLDSEEEKIEEAPSSLIKEILVK